MKVSARPSVTWFGRLLSPPVVTAFALPLPLVLIAAARKHELVGPLLLYAAVLMPSVILSALWFAVLAPLVMFSVSRPGLARPAFVILFSVLVASLFGMALGFLAHAYLPPHEFKAVPSVWSGLLSGALMGVYFGFVAGLAKCFSPGLSDHGSI